jgi:ketosteroid isomerase-like protein
MTDIASTIMDVFAAVERRDTEAFVGLCHPEVTFHWPPSLPYGSPTSGLSDEVGGGSGTTITRPTWEQIWDPLQPTSAERGMDPRIIGTTGNEVVVRWHQRGADPSGRRLDEEVLGLYQVKDGKLARAQMFYFDTARVSAFLAEANRPRR